MSCYNDLNIVPLKLACSCTESWSIAPTDNCSYANFDKEDNRSYVISTRQTIIPSLHFYNADSHSKATFDMEDSHSYANFDMAVVPTLFWQPGQYLLYYFDNPDNRSYIILTTQTIIEYMYTNVHLIWECVESVLRQVCIIF